MDDGQLSVEDRWTIVCCGLIAHADEVVDIGEWDAVMRMVPSSISTEQRNYWAEVLSDQERLEEIFADLEPVPAGFARELLWRSWQVALADGAGSDVEESQHDRVAVRAGIELEQAFTWRNEWTEQAAAYARIAVSLAAVFVNLDGRLDFHEAVHFENLLARMPVSLGDRSELMSMLTEPPELDDVVASLRELPESQRRAALHELAPLVRESHRAQRERDEFFDLAERIGVSKEDATQLLAVKIAAN